MNVVVRLIRWFYLDWTHQWYDALGEKNYGTILLTCFSLKMGQGVYLLKIPFIAQIQPRGGLFSTTLLFLRPFSYSSSRISVEFLAASLHNVSDSSIAVRWVSDKAVGSLPSLGGDFEGNFSKSDRGVQFRCFPTTISQT